MTQTSQFIIKRDTQLDDEYMAQILAQERRQALIESLQHLCTKTRQNGIYVARMVLKIMVDATKPS